MMWRRVVTAFVLLRIFVLGQEKMERDWTYLLANLADFYGQNLK